MPRYALPPVLCFAAHAMCQAVYLRAETRHAYVKQSLALLLFLA